MNFRPNSLRNNYNNINNYNNEKSLYLYSDSINFEPDLYSPISINFMQGIPMELLEPNNNKLKDYITCGICLDILLNPICCRNCKKKYCKNCIFRYKINNNQNKCPNCRQNFEIIEIDHTTKDILNDIKLKCYFFNEGCKEKLIYDSFIKHINSCKKGKYKYKCNTKNCGFISNLDDMIAHLDKCGLSLIKCEYCSNDFQKIIFDQHFNICKNVIIPCYYCFKKMEKFKLKNHENICPKYKIECKKCKEKICRENMNAHENNKLECYENRINYLEKYKEKSEKLIINLIERIDKLEKQLLPKTKNKKKNISESNSINNSSSKKLTRTNSAINLNRNSLLNDIKFT